MQGVTFVEPPGSKYAVGRRSGPVRRAERSWEDSYGDGPAAPGMGRGEEQHYSGTMEQKSITNLGRKKAVGPPRAPAHQPKPAHIPQGPHRQAERSWEDDRGVGPRPVPRYQDTSIPQGPHRKADPDFYREQLGGPVRSERPVVVNDNGGQTLMYEPRGPKRRDDRHWEQKDDAAPMQTQIVSSPARRAPARAIESSQLDLTANIAPARSYANQEGHKFYKRNDEGLWIKDTKTSVPQPVVYVRKHNESSIDLPLSKPSETYVRPGPRSPAPAGYDPNRVLPPDLHQKGIQAFRNRRWFNDTDLPSTISPRVRLGTANKPQGFNLPDYNTLPPNSPVTRPSARKQREALLYPDQRRSNNESMDMFDGLPNPRGDPRDGRQQQQPTGNFGRQKQDNFYGGDVPLRNNSRGDRYGTHNR